MKRKFFKLAKALADRSEHHTKIGAVIVKKNRVISVGYNKPRKTHPKSKHPFSTIHAELDAILGVSRKDLKDATIYVYREYKNGNPALARPCKYCWMHLEEVGIKKVYYTCSGGWKMEKITND